MTGAGLCVARHTTSDSATAARTSSEASARGIAYLAAGRPAGWNTAAPEEVFAPEPDPALRERYRRWLDLMQEAAGLRYL